jgi:hypothetical protein
LSPLQQVPLPDDCAPASTSHGMGRREEIGCRETEATRAPRVPLCHNQYRSTSSAEGRPSAPNQRLGLDRIVERDDRPNLGVVPMRGMGGGIIVGRSHGSAKIAPLHRVSSLFL